MKFVKMNGCGNDYVYFDLLGGGCCLLYTSDAADE